MPQKAEGEEYINLVFSLFFLKERGVRREERVYISKLSIPVDISIL
jgi:hypothetical protein